MFDFINENAPEEPKTTLVINIYDFVINTYTKLAPYWNSIYHKLKCHASV